MGELLGLAVVVVVVVAVVLASARRQRPDRSPPAAPSGPPTGSTRERLAELKARHDAGKISDDEYAARRHDIIEGS